MGTVETHTTGFFIKVRKITTTKKTKKSVAIYELSVKCKLLYVILWRGHRNTKCSSEFWYTSITLHAPRVGGFGHPNMSLENIVDGPLINTTCVAKCGCARRPTKNLPTRVHAVYIDVPKKYPLNTVRRRFERNLFKQTNKQKTVLQ